MNFLHATLPFDGNDAWLAYLAFFIIMAIFALVLRRIR